MRNCDTVCSDGEIRDRFTVAMALAPNEFLT
jgi:hypothetical protein